MAYLEYCSNCGERNKTGEIEGRQRRYCPNCDTIHYENPRPAATVLVVQDDQLLLVKRAMEPRAGWWCLPGGFMEIGENTITAAKRELREETGLEVDNLQFLDFCSMVEGPTGHVVVFAFTTIDFSGEVRAGDDASEAAFFPLADLPAVAFLCHQELINSYLQKS